MFKKSLLTLLATLSLGGALIAQTPPPVPPTTTISALPYTITAPGTYVLASNLPLNGSNNFAAISIQGPIAGPVVLDLGGFTVAATLSSSATGLNISNVNNNSPVNYPVTIQNGTITGFSQGASIGSSLDVTISHIVFKQTVFGINIFSSSDVAIDNCKFNGANTGISDGSPEGGNSYHHNTFVNCQSVLSVQGNRITPVVLGNCRFNSAN
jgi:hypothetical protein